MQKQITFFLMTSKNDLYNKQTPIYFRDLSSLNVEHYVKVPS